MAGQPRIVWILWAAVAALTFIVIAQRQPSPHCDIGDVAWWATETRTWECEKLSEIV